MAALTRWQQSNLLPGQGWPPSRYVCTNRSWSYARLASPLVRPLARDDDDAEPEDAWWIESISTALRGGTLWFLGDSTTAMHYWATLCRFGANVEPETASPVVQSRLVAVTGVPGKQSLRAEPSSLDSSRVSRLVLDSRAKQSSGARPHLCVRVGGAGRLANVSACFQLFETPSVSNPTAMLLALKPLLRADDVLVINFGLHYLTRKGRPDPTLLARDITSLLRTHAELTQHQRPTLLWRETSPEAFPTGTGAYPGAKAAAATPQTQGCRTPPLSKYNSFSHKSSAFFERYGHRIVRVHEASRLRAAQDYRGWRAADLETTTSRADINQMDAHKRPRTPSAALVLDCVHPCMPSPTSDYWVDALLATILDARNVTSYGTQRGRWQKHVDVIGPRGDTIVTRELPGDPAGVDGASADGRGRHGGGGDDGGVGGAGEGGGGDGGGAAASVGTFTIAAATDSAVQRAAPCTCFSVCTRNEAAAFVHEFLPSVIRSRTSPWAAYLFAVYGHQLTLPFDVSTIRFFYHNDHDYWPPDVEWPMATCGMNNGLQATNASRGTCEPAACARWRHLATQEEEGAPARTSLLVRRVVTFGHALGRSLGSLIVLHHEPNGEPSASPRGRRAQCEPSTPRASGEQSRRHCKDKLATRQHPNILPTPEGARRFWTSGTHAEVMRVNYDDARFDKQKMMRTHNSHAKARTRLRYEEGTHSYGIWFYAAPGSGVWLDLGKTLLITSVVDSTALGSSWVANASINHSAWTADAKFLQARMKGRELWPLRASGLGYDSVQNIVGNAPLFVSEFVAVRPQCMHGSVAHTCVPQVHLTVGPPERVGEHEPCVCTEQEPSLNCRGVAGAGLRAATRAREPWPYWNHSSAFYLCYHE